MIAAIRKNLTPQLRRSTDETELINIYFFFLFLFPENRPTRYFFFLVVYVP